MNTDKSVLQRKTRKKMLFLYARQGAMSLTHRKNRLFFALALFCFAFFTRLAYDNLIPEGVLEGVCQAVYKAVFLPLFLLLSWGCLIIIGAPTDCLKVSDNLQRVGFANSAGESPVLLSSEPVPDEPNMRQLIFDNCGLPLAVWQNEQEKLSAGLNVHIIDIEQGRSNRSIKMIVMPSNHQLPKEIIWNEHVLSETEYELVLGEGLTGRVRINLNKIPHVLIGGSTGSGKTVLLRSLLLQCIAKGSQVVIADFKGVDFHRVWEDHCEIIKEPENFLRHLDTILAELAYRKQLFSEWDCADIGEYNSNGFDLCHIVVACDEIAELLDKTGAGKEEKVRIAKIEAALSTIARQGRAFGLHLLLATQRPDASILAGQIKNNMDCRICGRADSILSQIILDNTDASDVIPKSATGRFIMNDRTIFQGYFVDDEMVKRVKVRNGSAK